METGYFMSREVALSFFRQTDVIRIARELLGKSLYTESEGIITGGIITETEAYAGVTDKASHAFGGRFTERTQIMYHEGGCVYIYLCYGIHSLFNIVTNVEGIPHAILIRAIHPTIGVEAMVERGGLKNAGVGFCKGPGKVSKALGIHYSHTGSLLSKEGTPGAKMKIWIEENAMNVPAEDIIITPRIGVDYAAEDALLPYRFELKTKTF
jgi:DNA-3-methyladenine glycosylase